MPWALGGCFAPVFSKQKARKNPPQKITREIHPELCSEKFPSDFCRSPFFSRSETWAPKRGSLKSFAIETPTFIACQADSPESLEFPIRTNHLIRANRANQFARNHATKAETCAGGGASFALSEPNRILVVAVLWAWAPQCSWAGAPVGREFYVAPIGTFFCTSVSPINGH